jgi:hypothetical protein
VKDLADPGEPRFFPPTPFPRSASESRNRTEEEKAALVKLLI